MDDKTTILRFNILQGKVIYRKRSEFIPIEMTNLECYFELFAALSRAL